jgi:hypothetical protein
MEVIFSCIDIKSSRQKIYASFADNYLLFGNFSFFLVAIIFMWIAWLKRYFAQQLNLIVGIVLMKQISIQTI